MLARDLSLNVKRFEVFDVFLSQIYNNYIFADRSTKGILNNYRGIQINCK